MLPPNVQRNIDFTAVAVEASAAGKEGRREEALQILEEATARFVGERLDDLVNLDVTRIEERLADRWKLRTLGMLLVLTADQLAPLGNASEATRRRALALKVMLTALRRAPDDPAMIDVMAGLAREVSSASLTAEEQRQLAEHVIGRGGGDQKVITLDERPPEKPR